MKKVLLMGMVMFAQSHGKDTTKIAGLPEQPLKELLNIFSIPYSSLEQVVHDTQQQWLRTAGKERWECGSIHENKREEIIALCEQLGLVQEIVPQAKSYTYTLILGATLPVMRSRIATCTALLDQGMHCEKMVFLTGHRDLLESEKKALEALGCDQDACTTEADMIRFLAQQSLSDRGITYTIIDAPEKVTATGKQRPTTADTVNQWMMQESPKPGTCLVVSSQPYCKYQHIVCASLLPKKFVIETIGKKASDNERVGTYLDTIARTLYQYQAYTKAS